MMSIDPDRIRVDLLRAKRKVFLEYPEGSLERKNFLLVAKMSEVDYLTKTIPVELVTSVVGDFERAVKDEAKIGVMALFTGVFLSAFLYIFHVIYPENFLLSLWRVGWFVGIAEMLRHGWHVVGMRKKVTPLLKEYDALKEKIKKLNNEIKGLK